MSYIEKRLKELRDTSINRATDNKYIAELLLDYINFKAAFNEEVGDFVTADELTNHKNDTNNPHNVTKTDVGLSNVDNTSDADKPVSTAQQTALDGKVDKAGDTMTGSLSMGNNKITNMANGTNPTDGVNLQQLESIKSLDSLRGNISPAIPAVYSIISTPQSIPNSSSTPIEWTNVIYDHFSLVSGTDITIPEWATHARITLGLLFENNNVGYRYGGVQLNGSFVYGDRSNAIDGSWTNLVFSTAIFPVSSGDIIRASVWQNSGSSLNISNEDDTGTWIQVELYENIS